MNKRISAALCTMTALAAVLAVPTAAHAADPYGQGFNTSTYDETVTVTVGYNDPQPKDLKVHVRKKGAKTPVATITKFEDVFPEDPCSPSCGDSWTLPLRGQVPKLAELGEYTIDVQYTGTAGETVLHKDKATLNYRLRPIIEHLSAANAVSLAAPDTVISGDVKVFDPRTATTKPFTDTFTANSGGVVTPLTADAKGHFQSKVKVSGAAGTYRPFPEERLTSVYFKAAVGGAEEEEGVTVPVTPVNARIALDAPTLTGAFSTEAKVTGTVTYEAADGTWKPVPVGASIHADTKVGETDDAGRFTVLNQFMGDGTWTVYGDSPWLKQDFITHVKVDTTTGTSFDESDASVDEFKKMRVRGWFNWFDIPAGVTSLKVDVQTSVDGKTGWTTRKTVDVAVKPGTKAETVVEANITYTGEKYVRMRYEGTKTIPGSVTTVEQSSRILTAIPEFNAAPEPVKKGQSITVTGRLDEGGPTWKPFADQPVTYYFRPAGATMYTNMGTSRTAADGTFTKTFKADRTGTWQARYQRNSPLYYAYFAATSRPDEVVVTP